MKKILFFILVVLCPIFSFGQSRAVKKFCKRYAVEDQNQVQVYIPKWAVKKVNKVLVNESPSNIKASAKFFRSQKVDQVNLIPQRHFRKMDRRLKREKFDPIIQIFQDGDSFQVYAKRDQDLYYHLVVLTEKDNELKINELGGIFNERFIRELQSKEWDIAIGD